MIDEIHEQDGLGLEYLDSLTFFDDKFEYHNKIYSYADIKHIEFTAIKTKHKVNFVPAGASYDARLLLHLRNRGRLHIKQERSFLGRKEKERFEATIRATEIFMNITFNQRIEVYECQMEEKGFVHWGEHQISRNGDLFQRNELQFNILKDDISLTLGPFHVECRRRNRGIGRKLREMWSGGAEVIDISMDRDCFLYVMKHYLGLAWPNHPVPEKRRNSKEIFYEALLILGGKLCKADGRISRMEIVRFKKYFGIDESTHPGASKIFMEAASSSTGAKEAARKIFDLFDGKKEPLEYVLLGLVQIATVDGQFDQSEKDFIHIVAKEFDFSDANIERLFLIFENAQEQRSYSSEGTKTETPVSKSRVRYLRILGLDDSATNEDIKVAYRDLARKHHPDLLRAQGVPIDDIMNAEEILKVINLAYEWLERHQQSDTRMAT